MRTSAALPKKSCVHISCSGSSGTQEPECSTSHCHSYWLPLTIKPCAMRFNSLYGLRDSACIPHREGAGLLRDSDLSRAACVILDDDRKSRVDGFELLNQLRDRDIRMPAILPTGHATGGLRARAATAGIQMVLEKPLLDNVLVNSIRTILGIACGASQSSGQ
jgi:CheY-like chemotaxis protein